MGLGWRELLGAVLFAGALIITLAVIGAVLVTLIRGDRE